MRTDQLIDDLELLAARHKDDKYFTFETRWIDVLEAVINKLKELGWHTGTPTEDGWYLVAYECVYDCKNKGKIEYFTLNIITDEDGYRDYRGRASDDVWKAVAWQKIEPYKGDIDNENE